ncbi:MAG: helix-hairpin-helix domain-containing protein [Candidatus Zambryskibacteria bacterium]|nr:helix-hairpin-helix domain-containing protein [Candidatus Zambryskibacteria bacterium]
MPAGIYKKFFLISFFLIALPAILYAQSGLININTAGSDELQTLNGIGPAYAQRIIDYRTQNGPFTTIDDIKKVSGIGEVTFSKIKDYITVGEVNASTTGAGDNSNQANTQTTQNSSSSNILDGTSTHYSATPLTTSHQLVDVPIGAGRDRLGSVGSPLEFRAETDFNYVRNTIFQWNFGDGSEGVGDILNHTYQYPGEYVVVLNASLPDGRAVARVNVKIVDPEIVITLATSERIELQNKSKYEISLFGRALVMSGKIFAFPKDTIIKAGQKISFGANVTGLSSSIPSEVSLMIVGTEIKPQEVMAKIENQKLEKITQINNQISTLRQQLVSISNQQNNVNAATTVNASPLTEESIESENNESQTALVADAITSEESSGIIKSWLQTLKHFFFRTQE